MLVKLPRFQRTYGLAMFVIDVVRDIRLFTETGQSVVQSEDFRVLDVQGR